MKSKLSKKAQIRKERHERHYRRIFQIIELMKIEDFPEPEFQKVIARGEFELHDYGTGLYIVHVYFFNDVLRVTISTIDDGYWQGYAKDNSIRTFRMLRGFFDGLNSLPTSDELNEMLSKIGVYGEFDL